MYARIVLNPGWTTGYPLIEMFEKLLTGETDLTALGQDKIDLNQSSIDSSVTGAGWVMHDAQHHVLRSQVLDTSFNKFVKFHWDNSYGIKCMFYNDWDEISHTGNISTSSTNMFPYIWTEISGSKRTEVFLSCSKAHIAVLPMKDGAQHAMNIWSEYIPASPWDEPSQSKLPVLWSKVLDSRAILGFVSTNLENVGGDFALPSFIGYNGAQVSNASAVSFIRTAFGSKQDVFVNDMLGFNQKTNRLFDKNLNRFVPMVAFGHSNATLKHIGGNITEACDIWLLPKYEGAKGDIIDLGDKIYAIWESHAYRFAVRIG